MDQRGTVSFRICNFPFSLPWYLYLLCGVLDDPLELAIVGSRILWRCLFRTESAIYGKTHAGREEDCAPVNTSRLREKTYVPYNKIFRSLDIQPISSVIKITTYSHLEP